VLGHRCHDSISMSDGTPVYSTASGDLRRPVRRAPAPRPEPKHGFPDDGVVRIARSKNRKGAGITAIHGLPGGEAALKATATDLKRLCGAGGAVRDGIVEVQGDHRDRIAAHLAKQGLTVRLAGG